MRRHKKLCSIEDTWMTSTVWTVPTWSVFNQSIRINNDVEEWHHKQSRKARKGNLQFYLLITLMYSEAKRLPTQMKMISEGKLKRYRCKRSRTVQSQVQQKPSQCVSSPEEVWCNLRSRVLDFEHVMYIIYCTF